MNDTTVLDPFESDRARMVEVVARYGVTNPCILEAMRRLPRHAFMPASVTGANQPYEDRPLPIGYGQTISQPYIVAYMTDRLGVQPGDRILDIGTGSGYQAAVLAAIGAEVYTIELVPELAAHASRVFRDLGLATIHAREGDGYKGWPEHAPYQGILAGCAPESIPQPLIDQLANGARMILPVGDKTQYLVIVEKDSTGHLHQTRDLPVRFVPMHHDD